MNLTLGYWKLTTGEGKISLAEESQLWDIHADENYYSKTNNMEQYLSSKTLPKHPKWQNVIKTAQFALQGENCIRHDSETLDLKEEIEKEILFTRLTSWEVA